MTTLRIAFAGTPEFAVPALHALVASDHRVVGVLTQPDRPSGRGRKITLSPVKEAALAHGLPVSQPLTLKTPEGREALFDWKPDLLVVVAYGLILPREVLALPGRGCINIHASLLPRWRGAAPIQRSLLAGDSETGISIMMMETGLDTGPVLLRKVMPIGPRDTSGLLHDRLSQLGAGALMEALQGLIAGALYAEPQSCEGVTYASKIEKAEAQIDWTESVVEIDRKIRAFNPWPIAETRYEGEQLRILEASVSGISSPVKQPGAIVELMDQELMISCGSGALAITRVQRPGRRPVSAMDFAHSASPVGHRFG